MPINGTARLFRPLDDAFYESEDFRRLRNGDGEENLGRKKRRRISPKDGIRHTLVCNWLESQGYLLSSLAMRYQMNEAYEPFVEGFLVHPQTGLIDRQLERIEMRIGEDGLRKVRSPIRIEPWPWDVRLNEIRDPIWKETTCREKGNVIEPYFPKSGELQKKMSHREVGKLLPMSSVWRVENRDKFEIKDVLGGNVKKRMEISVDDLRTDEYDGGMKENVGSLESSDERKEENGSEISENHVEEFDELLFDADLEEIIESGSKLESDCEEGIDIIVGKPFGERKSEEMENTSRDIEQLGKFESKTSEIFSKNDIEEVEKISDKKEDGNEEKIENGSVEENESSSDETEEEDSSDETESSTIEEKSDEDRDLEVIVEENEDELESNNGIEQRNESIGGSISELDDFDTGLLSSGRSDFSFN